MLATLRSRLSSRLPSLRLHLLLWTCLVLFGCGGGGGAAGGGTVPGGLRVVGERILLVDSHQRGQADDLQLVRVLKGRLVDVFGLDAEGRRVLVLPDFLVGPFVETSEPDYRMTFAGPLGQEQLTISRDVTDRDPRSDDSANGFDQFLEILLQVQSALIELPMEAVDTLSPPVFERNAALALVFNDLLDEDSVTPSSVASFVGTPESGGLRVARVFPSAHHGDVESGQFGSTRVIVDPVVSQLDTLRSAPSILQQGVLPAAAEADEVNYQLRLPLPQGLSADRLVNLRGRGLDEESDLVGGNQVEPAWVLGLRTGAAFDPLNGFLADPYPPELLTDLPGLLTAAPISTPAPFDGGRFSLPELRFAEEGYQRAPRRGDLLVQAGLAAIVLEDRPLENGVVRDLAVRVLAYPRDWDALHAAGDAQLPRGYLEWAVRGEGQPTALRTSYSGTEQDIQLFLEVVPRPPLPGLEIDPGASFSLSFSEPIDPLSWRPVETFRLNRSDLMGPLDSVVGQAVTATHGQRATFVPSLPLAHEQGTAELYQVRLGLEDKPRDGLGNEVEFLPAALTFFLRSEASTQRNRGWNYRFSSLDQVGPGASPEWAGHIRLEQGRLLPRPVSRFDAVLDQSQAVPSLMGTFPQGVQTPLSGLGSKLQYAWRSVDAGLTLDDRDLHDLDLEGLSWSPAQGVVSEVFERFEIRLAHSRRLPDESVFASGLLTTFQNNLLEAATVVHPRTRGYSLDPAELYTGSSGTPLMPYPWNRGTLAPATTFTWRDTSQRIRGGEDSAGSEVNQYYVAMGQAIPPKRYPAGEVPTIGLPLLLEFRTYPDDTAFGLNPFGILLASGTLPATSFRAFSTGGVGSSGTVTIQPDSEPVARGGIDPSTGGSTMPTDPVTYIGAMDIVVRVNRAYSVWVPTQFTTTLMSAPVLHPPSQDQPQGTSVRVDFRGASSLSGWQTDAERLDSYGDGYLLETDQTRSAANPDIDFFRDDAWYPASQMSGAYRYLQARLTMTSNIETGDMPELRVLGLSWEEGN